MSGSVSYRKDDAIAVVTLDDGKVNVLSPGMLQEIKPRSEARIMSLVIYAVMGWVVVVAIKPLLDHIGNKILYMGPSAAERRGA